MNSRTERIYVALDQLCDALALGRSESSTERLSLVLAMAFNDENAEEMEKILEESHDEGLAINMRGLVADGIFSVFQASHPSWQRSEL
jgi:hypothetical protein